MQFVIVCVANKNISVTESDVGTTGGRIMKIGEKFTFKGYEWVALEVNKDNVWAIMTKAWDTAEFDENNRNDWKNSSIRKRLREELLPILGEENLITRSVDLVADNGDRRYGRCDDKIWLLSCDDFRKYRETILANCDFEDDWWWTLTPWHINDVGYGHYVRLIYPAGNVGIYSASNSFGVAPACVFHLASLASAPSGAQEDLPAKIKAEVDVLKEQIRKIEEMVQECIGGKADD